MHSGKQTDKPKDALYRSLIGESPPWTQSQDETMAERSSLPLPRAWINALFTRLRSIYGSKIEQTYGTTDAEDLMTTWATTLAPYSGDDIKMALDDMQLHYVDWPPTLAQFRNLCRDAAARSRRGQQKLTHEPERPPIPEHLTAQMERLKRKWNVTPKR